MGSIEHYFVKKQIREYFKNNHNIMLCEVDEQAIMSIVEDNHNVL